jgi:ribonuclease P/MRP protein subunit RPP40
MIHMYADDTKLSCKVCTKEDQLEMQADLNSLDQWSSTWQLKFNAGKCKVMHLGSKNQQVDYSMKDNGVNMNLEVSVLEKDLGVWVDNKLKFTEHIDKAIVKGNQLLGLIYRTIVYRDGPLMKRLCTALVRPHLEYANAVWHPRYKKDSDNLERVQHRATRMVPGMSNIPYEERLRKLDLPSLVYRRYRGDMIEVYKYLHGLYDMDHSSLIPLHTGRITRGHSMKLQKKTCKLQL